MVLRRLLEPKLRTPVAVKHQARLLAWVPLEPRHAQGIDDDVPRHVVAQRPAHHLATEQGNHHGQKSSQPSSVAIHVMSPTQTLFRAATTNSRSSKLGEIGRS